MTLLKILKFGYQSINYRFACQSLQHATQGQYQMRFNSICIYIESRNNCFKKGVKPCSDPGSSWASICFDRLADRDGWYYNNNNNNKCARWVISCLLLLSIVMIVMWFKIICILETTFLQNVSTSRELEQFDQAVLLVETACKSWSLSSNVTVFTS